MSTLLEQASLVLIPSGIKASKVYCEIPEDGSGDMTFARASDATRVNSLGLVEKVRTNLFTQSQNATLGNWGNPYNIGSVTANSTTAPDGTNTGNLIVENSANTNHWFEQSFSATNGNGYTISVYAKAKERTQIVLFGFTDNFVFSGQVVIFNLSNGTVVSQSGTQLNSITSVGNGWYRCSMTLIAQATATAYWGYGLALNGSGSYQGDGTSGLYMWGRQNEVSDFGPTAYIPTTSSAVSVGPYSNIPRLNYQNGGGGCPSLLLEAQRTNLITYSESINNSFTTRSSVTITENNTTSPDGYQNADLLKFDTTTAYILRNQVVSASTAYTMSIFVKNNTFTSGELLTFNMSDGVIGGLTAQINVVAKTATFSAASGAYTSVSGKVEDYGNGWFRVSVTGTSIGGGSGWYELAASNVTNSCYIWGFSLEAGNYVSSYIPTLGTSVTRVEDECYKTGISSLIGQSEGTLFVDVNLNHLSSSNDYLIQVSESGSNRFFMYREGGGNKVGCFALIGGSTIYQTLTAADITGRIKAAFAYKSGSFAFYINGSQIGTSTATFSTPPTMGIFNIDSNDNTENGYFSYNETILFPTRLTNAQLADLTTL